MHLSADGKRRADTGQLAVSVSAAWRNGELPDTQACLETRFTGKVAPPAEDARMQGQLRGPAGWRRPLAQKGPPLVSWWAVSVLKFLVILLLSLLLCK